jgi:hypothetical protein
MVEGPSRLLGKGRIVVNTRRVSLAKSAFVSVMRITMLAGLLTCLFVPTVAMADSVIYDGFSNGNLDPAWQQQFGQYANGWSFVEAGTNLTTTDIFSTIVNTESNDKWSVVNLKQTCIPLNDFAARLAFSWDSEGSNEAMQCLILSLRDGAGNLVIAAGYDDAWVLHTGSVIASPGDGSICDAEYILHEGIAYESGYDSLPLSGSATVEVSRTGNDISVLWNSSPCVTVQSSVAIEQVEIMLGYYSYSNPKHGTPFFGSESVDYIEVCGPDSAAVPEPASVVCGLIGLGMIGAYIRKWRSGVASAKTALARRRTTNDTEGR